jgi:hypothetical protein
VRAEAVAELEADRVGVVVANDAQRASFTIVVGSELRAVAGDDLRLLHSWPLAERLVGWPATLPAAGLAVVGASDHISLLAGDGSVRSSLAHPPWLGGTSPAAAGSTRPAGRRPSCARPATTGA